MNSKSKDSQSPLRLTLRTLKAKKQNSLAKKLENKQKLNTKNCDSCLSYK
jgi:hypothetical protein